MSPHWLSRPEVAWVKHVLPEASSNAKWVNDSTPVSKEINLSKREIFGLVILAHLYSGQGKAWNVGYDPNQGEPNDGFITDGETTICVEHTVVVEEAKQEVLEAILAVYRDKAAQGKDYGKDCVLMIQANKESDHGGMIRISDLAVEIGKVCNFDRVLTLGMVSQKKQTGVMHVIQHYPEKGKGIGQVDFDFPTGAAEVPHCGIEL